MSLRNRPTKVVTAALVVVLLLAGCGGKDDDSSGDENPAVTDDAPQRGGSLSYALEAETGGGFCLQEAQLAIAGIMVARSVYDTLTVPNSDGDYVPYLAESVEPNDDYSEWVITVRDGITFHDGSDLTAEVVKNNLDAYRGADGEHARTPLLFLFVLANIDTVEVTADLEVTVSMKVPWVAFPAFLYSSGRLGMTAQAQLDDTESCERQLIGTGPFMLESPDDWVEGREMKLTKNPDYWQMAPDGEPYPYLDELIYEPIPDPEQRGNAFESTDVQMAHFSNADEIISVRDLTEAGDVGSFESTVNAEVGFVQMNLSRPPFDDVRVRQALALALDLEDYREVINRGVQEPANGPFAPGSEAYLEDTGYATGDTEAAQALIAEYEAENGPIRALSYLAGPDPIAQEQAVYMQQTFEAIGLEITLETAQQDAVIDRAISGEFDMQAFRNYPGGDPDLLYNWFQSASPVNFGRINSPEIDGFLDDARSDPDHDARMQMYQDMNTKMGTEAMYLWLNLTTWIVGGADDVHGYDPETYPALPDDGGSFDEGLAAGQPVHGLWIEQ